MLTLLALLAFLCLLWVAYWVVMYLRDEDKYTPGYVSGHQCTDCAAGSVSKLGKHVHTKHAHGSGSASGSARGIAAGAGSNAHAGSGAGASSSGGASGSGNVAGAGSSGSSQGSNIGGHSPAGQSHGSSASASGSPGGGTGARSVAPLYTRPTGKADDLKKIYGVGEVMEGTLNDLGVTTYQQMADFQDADIQKVSDALSEQNAGFGDRITRDEWVPQAKLLAAGQPNAAYGGGSGSNQAQPVQGHVSNASAGSAGSAGQAGGTGARSVTPLYTRPIGYPDDLKKIYGVGDVMEGTLNDLGITTYQQLADFQDADVQRVSDALSEQNSGFGDRITRDEWVAQAKLLAAGQSNASYGGGSGSNPSPSGQGSSSSASASVSNAGGNTGSSSGSNPSQSGQGSNQSASPSSGLASGAGGVGDGAPTKSGLTQQFTRPTETADDLTVIKGIGVVMEETLNDLGITTYKQLGDFQEADVETVKDALSQLHAGFGDRISRDKWVAQARVLAARNRS